MKHFICFILILLIIYLFIFYTKIIPNLSIVNQLFFQRYLISLFPFIFITNLFMKNNGFFYLYKKFENHRNIFNLIIILFVILIGLPGSINLLNHLEKIKIYNNKQKNHLLSCFGGISFPFVFLVLLNENIFRYKIIAILFFIEFCFYFYNVNQDYEGNTILENDKANIDVVFSTLKSLATVLFSLLFFSLFNFIFNYFKSPFNNFFGGLIEFSYNCIQLSKNSDWLSIIFLNFIISFTSLSLISQIILLDENFKIVNYLKKRALIALLSTLLISFFF